MKLRPYQKKAVSDVRNAWASGRKVVMLRLPTGGGKTPTFSQIINDEPGSSVVIAHRSELVSQASLALAKYGVTHRVIGSSALSRECTRIHLNDDNVRYDHIDPNARCAVASVNTLINKSDPWFNQVKLWVVDEGHHLQRENVWGTAVNKFPNSRGLAVTATPGRPDGKGLGAHNDGLAEILVNGPELRELINSGYLCDYKIYCPPSDIDVSQIPITASGDFSQDKLAKAIHASKSIVGDVVEHYLKIAPGKLGITFAVDIEAATELARAFRHRGVPAEVITGKTPPDLRASIMRRLRRREILQVTNVGVLGEGVDVPAVEVVSIACHTNSFIKYAQEFGRMLRLLIRPELAAQWDDFTDEERLRHIANSDKPYGILLDHVGNLIRHGGPPDKLRTWSLDRRGKRSSGPSDAIPYRICANPECVQPYERIHKCCPHCGFYPEPAARSSPEYVDGDLLELDEATLMALRGEIARIDGDPVIPWGASPIVEGAVRKNHRLRQEAQGGLRNALAWWAGLQDSQGLTESQSLRKFYFKFGVDVAGSQSLGMREAEELTARINRELAANGIDGNVNVEAYLSNRG